uniref:Uncharacterized protein n=1 Tax=Rhizophora mucronata TaxID=61149 RepID=A0A2P2LPN4_RHIMU
MQYIKAFVDDILVSFLCCQALELNGQSLGGREVRLDVARKRSVKGDRGSYTPYNGYCILPYINNPIGDTCIVP